MCVPNGNVKFGGSYDVSAVRLGSMPSGRLWAWKAAKAAPARGMDVSGDTRPRERRAGDHLDLPGRRHPDGGRFPPARHRTEGGHDAGRGQAADLHVGGEPDPEVPAGARLPALLLLLAEPLVADDLQGLVEGRLVVAGVERQAGRREVAVVE